MQPTDKMAKPFNIICLAAEFVKSSFQHEHIIIVQSAHCSLYSYISQRKQKRECTLGKKTNSTDFLNMNWKKKNRDVTGIWLDRRPYSQYLQRHCRCDLSRNYTQASLCNEKMLVCMQRMHCGKSTQLNHVEAVKQQITNWLSYIFCKYSKAIPSEQQPKLFCVGLSQANYQSTGHSKITIDQNSTKQHMFTNGGDILPVQRDFHWN